ncbi:MULTISPECIES: glycoside hydrolase [Paenibacillus]|uniref:glycoside hydrolase n=1 Tax=Paenibacillus TaxID=44249 RepID=UPI0022B8EE95|nr:glycoside hydrolase [Paenibacillus caseinilyticus]MCZ8517936.1 hypothetical protein [Paenibacillus caseinilyticus]
MKTKLRKKFTAALLTCTCLINTYGFSYASSAAPDSTVSIDASASYQRIDNFGASDAWSMEPLGKHWTEDNKNRVADLLFSRDKGIGLSAWRFNIGAGSTETDQEIISNPWRRAEAFKSSEDGKYDWSKQAGQQWFLKAAKDRGVDTLIAFVNSPPVWMTKNGHAQPDSTVGSTNLKEGYEDEFAAYLIDVLKHFKQKGLEFQYISPINEPTWDWNKAGQEGNRYNNEDLKRVILELHRQLKKKGLKSTISAPDGVEITALLDDEFYKMFSNKEQYTGGANSLGTGKYREYIKDLLGDPKMKEAVGNKIASHSYWSDYSSPGDDRLGKLRELLDANMKKYEPAAVYWMSEYCILGSYGPGRDLGIDPALHVARTIHYDLTKANASAWQWWTAVSKEDYKDGLIYTDFNQAGDEQNILTSKILWALGNYSKFIRPGAKRIALTGLDEQARSGLLGSAYLHEGEKTVTAVFVNDSQEEKRVKIDVKGLGKKESVFVLKSYVTSADRDLMRGADIPVQGGGTFEAVIPARSVVTLNGDVMKENKKPEAPKILDVKPLNKGLKVEFSAPKGAYEYEVTYGVRGETRKQKFTLVSGEEVVIGGLENGKKYDLTLRAGNRNGFSPPSKRVQGTPALLAPSGVSAAGKDGGFHVYYEAGGGVPAYRVRYGTQSGVYTKELLSGTPNGSIQVEGLSNGTTYYGVVEAVDGAASSPSSKEFTVLPDAPAPGKIIAVPGNGSAHVEFGQIEGASGYAVQVLAGSEPIARMETDKTSFDIKDLTNGSPVTVRVAAIGKGGQGTGYTETAVTPEEESVRVADSFEDGNMSRYRQDLSSWKMEDGLLKHVSGSDSQGEVSMAGMEIIDGTMTAIAKHATSGADWGIAFRGTSHSKGYIFGFENGVLTLKKDGQNLAPAVPFTAKPGELYKLEVHLEGKQIRAFIDGKPVFGVEDTSYTSGRAGLHSWGDAQFAYVQVTGEGGQVPSKPVIYQVKAGDRQVSLQFSQVDGADAYVVRYKPATVSDDTYAEVPADPGSAIVTGLTNGTAYSFTVVAKRGVEAILSEPVEATPSRAGSQALYYVDAGDDTPGKPEEGETLGTYQSLEEQPYGKDPVTGSLWGYEADEGLTWARTGSTDPYDSIRQYDGNTNGKGLAYRFEVPNGTYKVTAGFFDPWHAADRAMSIVINGETKLDHYLIGSNKEEKTFGGITVTGGELIVKAVKGGGSKPMLSWLKVETDIPPVTEPSGAERILHYDMSQIEGAKVKDQTGTFDGTWVNPASAEWIRSQEAGVLSFAGGKANSYIELPGGILNGLQDMTVSTLVNWSGGGGAEWLYALGRADSSTHYTYFTPKYNADSSSRLGIATDGWKNEVSAKSATLPSGEWKLVTAVLSGKDSSLSLYIDGVPASKAGLNGLTLEQIRQELGASGFIGKSFYPADPYFGGMIADFQLYNGALTEAEIKGLKAEADAKVARMKGMFVGTAAGKLAYSDILGANASENEVVKNLTLPANGSYGTSITWKSSLPAVITDAGVVQRPAFEAGDQTVTLTAAFSDGTKSATREFTVTVLRLPSDEQAVQLDKEALVVHHVDDVRGNLTLPAAGANGTTITWKSEAPGIITTTGEVTRPGQGSGDAAVKLTATVSRNGASEAKEFQAIVKERPAQEKYAGYLFSYFTGEGTADGEQIYLALSEGNDPLHWQETNKGKPVLTSGLGEKGVRDPFIIRSPEGDKFYMIATDLKINGNSNWDRAQRQGSRSIMVWESNDLVDWSEQRMVEVAPEEAGNTWAPEVFYDDKSGEYIVFWASKIYADQSHTGNTYQKMMYSKTRDFYTFTKPQVYMDFGHSVIDTTMIANEGKVYRFTKDERDNTSSSPYGKMVFQEAAASVFDPGFTMIKEGVGGSKGVEGPTVFKSNTEEKWYLFVDEFGGRGYIPYETTDLDLGAWTLSSDYKLPASPRHGTVLPITQTEYDAIRAKYN